MNKTVFNEHNPTIILSMSFITERDTRIDIQSKYWSAIGKKNILLGTIPFTYNKLPDVMDDLIKIKKSQEIFLKPSFASSGELSISFINAPDEIEFKKRFLLSFRTMEPILISLLPKSRFDQFTHTIGEIINPFILSILKSKKDLLIIRNELMGLSHFTNNNRSNRTRQYKEFPRQIKLGLNINKLLLSNILEINYHHATLNTHKISNWIDLLMRITQRAIGTNEIPETCISTLREIKNFLDIEDYLEKYILDRWASLYEDNNSRMSTTQLIINIITKQRLGILGFDFTNRAAKYVILQQLLCDVSFITQMKNNAHCDLLINSFDSLSPIFKELTTVCPKCGGPHWLPNDDDKIYEKLINGLTHVGVMLFGNDIIHLINQASKSNTHTDQTEMSKLISNIHNSKHVDRMALSELVYALDNVKKIIGDASGTECASPIISF